MPRNRSIRFYENVYRFFQFVIKLFQYKNINNKTKDHVIMLSPSSSANDDEDVFTYQIEVLFPNITEDKIKTVEFLDAARGLVRIIGMHLVSSKYHITYTKTKSIKTNTNVSEKLGKVFAPVKYDIQGNIDKLTSRHVKDKEKNAILQDMILIEKNTETKLIATDALTWLTRALHMILLFFEQIVEDSKTATPTEDLVAFLKKAYKEALQPYHGWMAQQLFDVTSFAHGSYTFATFTNIY
ncbi:uncharacterized protein LOC117154876 isoform X3 [Bombus vancouverensis nearcticus]|uniref:uncharacterized protein LOC117154876 isoform X3 n=1 Tax=Bombus vancouverensis nearcticus TaxID=2705178 RepID=UPI00402B7B1D